MNFKAVVADVDGTLIEPGVFPAPFPTQRLKKAVCEAQKKNVVFSLASARSLVGVENLVSGLNITSPIILDNGAKIYDCKRRKYIWESILPKQIAFEILEFTKKQKVSKIIIVDNDERLTDFSKIRYWQLSKIAILDISPQKAEEIYQILKQNPKIHVTKSISSVNPVKESIHVTNFDATKQVAIHKFAQILGIKTSQIIGIGDSYNDFPMLLSCGLKVAMKNATPDIKEIADYIAPSYDQDGVAFVLEKFILQQDFKSQTPNFKAKSQRLATTQNAYQYHDLEGERKDQLLALCDKKGNRLGSATREECHKGKGKTHLAFMAFLLDKKRNVVLTRRSKNKSLWPGFWDASVVSHILPGEKVEEAASRRCREELGVTASFRKIGEFYYFARQGSIAENEYCFVLVGKTNKKVVPNPMEIGEIKFLPVDKIKKSVIKDKKIYTPWFILGHYYLDSQRV